MRITLLAAADENNVIGAENALPWKLPLDFQRMKKLTMGKPLIMGRKTHESIGRALPGRRNIVITRKKSAKFPGCDVVHSLEEALALAKKDRKSDAIIFGGAEIYAQALPIADRIELTRVHARFKGDAHFPEFSPEEWELVARERHEADAQHAVPFSFLTYDRRARRKLMKD
jgi:dihydrofolate reductase